ncbi:MAG TPA: urate oxidase [Drouetiella sp.]|jgi:urate oxidase
MTGTEQGTITKETRAAGVLVQNAYGKSRVRVSKLTRANDRHVFKEVCVDIQLKGDFERTYTAGDNSQVVATDSMKNMVYVLASKHPLDTIESFGQYMAEHYLKTYKQVSGVKIRLVEELWHRIVVNGKEHAHSFFGAGPEKRVAEIDATRDGVTINAGIEGLKLVKTTASEFWGFVRDEHTTLPDVTDRIFGTSVSCHWLYRDGKVDFQAAYDCVRNALLECFATHHSLAVQHTINEIGQLALLRVPEISEITIEMPNQHRIPFNLEPFKLENKNEIFVTTDEPYGLISATLRRI